MHNKNDIQKFVVKQQLCNLISKIYTLFKSDVVFEKILDLLLKRVRGNRAKYQFLGQGV